MPMTTRGKIASQVIAAWTWIDGGVRADESEGSGSGRVMLGLPATAIRWSLQPDVLLGDRAVAPLGQSHHPATVLKLADHAGPVTRAEPDRMGLDLEGRATGALDEGLHCLDVLTDATRRSLPVDIHEN